MTRFLAAWSVLTLLTAWLAAQDAARPSALDQRQLFQRNRALITTLIEEGVDLAGKRDPLQRVEKINRMARHLADATREAIRERNPHRANEFGTHLRTLLERGATGNLEQARARIRVGSEDERTLFALRDASASLLEPVESLLDDPRGQELTALKVGLRELRSHLDDAVKVSR